MKARTVKGLRPWTRLDDAAERIVCERLDELWALGSEAAATGATETLHDLRIAAKRLRYVLEILGHTIGPYAEKATAQAKSLQDLLGDLHDCDVLLPRLEGEADLAEVADHLAARRARLHTEFDELWLDLERRGVRARLEFAAKERPAGC